MSTPLTILHEGHRKVVRVGANDNMSIVLQVCVHPYMSDSFLSLQVSSWVIWTCAMPRNDTPCLSAQGGV